MLFFCEERRSFNLYLLFRCYQFYNTWLVHALQMKEKNKTTHGMCLKFIHSIGCRWYLCLMIMSGQDIFSRWIIAELRELCRIEIEYWYIYVFFFFLVCILESNVVWAPWGLVTGQAPLSKNKKPLLSIFCKVLFSFSRPLIEKFNGREKRIELSSQKKNSVVTHRLTRCENV